MHGSYLKAKERNISGDNIKSSLVDVNMYEAWGGKQPAQLLAVVQKTNNRACSLERLSENPKETWAVRTHSAKGVPPV